MRIYLISPYLANTKCLWHQTKEMGGRNRCIGSASVSFSIHLKCVLVLHRSQKHTGYVYGRLSVLMPLGGVPLPLTGLQVLTDPNTLF